jgi:hypothetical protein
MPGKFIAVMAMIFGACYTAMPLTLVGTQFNRSFDMHKRREAMAKTKEEVHSRLALAPLEIESWTSFRSQTWIQDAKRLFETGTRARTHGHVIYASGVSCEYAYEITICIHDDDDPSHDDPYDILIARMSLYSHNNTFFYESSSFSTLLLLLVDVMSLIRIPCIHGGDTGPYILILVIATM